MGLATSIASRIHRQFPLHSRDDLEQAGCLGLLSAASRYDCSRGVPFSVYARQRVRGAILDWLSREGAPAGRSLEADIEAQADAVRPGPDLVAARRESRRLLRAEIARLPERQRLVIEYRLAGLDQRECGRRLGGISQQGVSDLERRARRRLKRQVAA